MALDVYEHAYFLDYQTDRASYIDAFFDNLDWDVVNGWVEHYADAFVGESRDRHRPDSSRSATSWGRCPGASGSCAPSAHEDIRKQGSGNIGASNVWRTYGWKLGLPVLLLDVAKGFVPAFVAVHTVGYLAAALAGGAAMLGHYRPVFLGFQKGGKTVATAGGVFLGMAPLAALVGLAVWIIVFVTTRYPSVASMVTAISLVAWSWLFGYPWPVTTFAAITAVARDPAPQGEHPPAHARRGAPLDAVATLVAQGRPSGAASL